jgi:hypothetical protein
MPLNQMFYGPLWPLPRATYGQPITDGLTGLLETSEYYEAAAMDIIVSTPSTNTGDVYLVLRAMDGTFDKDNDGTVILLISPGGSRNLAQAAYHGNKYKLADIGVDSDDYNDDYFICAIMQ